MFHIHLSSPLCRPLLLGGVGLLVAACGLDDSGAGGLLDQGTAGSAAPTTHVRDAAPREDAAPGRNSEHDAGQVEGSSATPEASPPDATSLTRPEASTDF